MASHPQIRSLGRFLYTQNPFYLISCFLILYGLQIATIANGNLLSRSVFLTISIAAYTLLMAVTCVAVVRLGKVWEDARSILLVVLISQVALSTGLDELSIIDWNTATPLLILGATFAFVITEMTLRSCRLRLPSWYRMSLYAIGLVFFLTPVALGHAVGTRNTTLTSWGAPLFSTLIGAGLLLLVPAMRKGPRLVADNGTPWSWPLYPLSAFAILVVLAAIRSHAVWMSFGYIGGAVRFEPFLLLPIALAVLVLFVESERQQNSSARSFCAMAAAPAMLLCGISRGGMTHLPIHADMQTYFGSAQTIALASLLGFYLYMWVRGTTGSEFAVIGTLLAFCGFSDLPRIADAVGLRHWMFAGGASAFMLANCLWDFRSDRKWLVFAMLTVVTLLMAGHTHDQLVFYSMIAGTFAVAAMLTIGACFTTELATFLRQTAAALLIAASSGVVAWEILRSPGMIPIALLMAGGAVSLVYMQIIRRRGWLYIFAIQSTCLIAVLGWHGYESGALSQGNWPIQSGLMCFLIGLTITSAKTGLCVRIQRRLPVRPCLRAYRSGL